MADPLDVVIYSAGIQTAAAALLGGGAGGGFGAALLDYGGSAALGAAITQKYVVGIKGITGGEANYLDALAAGAISAGIVSLGSGGGLGLDTPTLMSVATGAISYYAANVLAPKKSSGSNAFY